MNKGNRDSTPGLRLADLRQRTKSSVRCSLKAGANYRHTDRVRYFLLYRLNCVGRLRVHSWGLLIIAVAINLIAHNRQAGVDPVLLSFGIISHVDIPTLSQFTGRTL